MSFSKDFIWGVAAASYQVEGAWNEDGKGPSIWDTYTHKTPSPIRKSENGDIACDHYHRMKEDVALLVEMGVKAYRFSISWPRILPSGTGKVNEKGLAFYSDLVDELLKNNIEPMITLRSREIELLGDQWTIVTQDGSPTAHYENTILITDEGPFMTTYDYEEGF